MSKRVRISNNSLNSYGTRVLTAGMNVEQYCRNPVLLYMHERGNVIGYVKDVKVENDEVTGELVFDEATELSKRCKRQFEFGSLKMVSAGLDIIELSEDSKYLVAGQTSPTITKSKLFEVSVVDIGANDDALVLKKDGKRITLGRDGECPLPELTNNKPLKQEHQMESKAIALQLGLPETATDAEIAEKLGEFKLAKEENAKLQKEKAVLTLASITSLVEKAIGEKRIGADKKDEFVSLGKEIGAEKLSSVFAAMSPQVKLSTILGQHGTAKPEITVTYSKLSEVPGDKLAEMREQQPDEYKRLYKAEYGMECEI
ncbi:HK97 family phage prohead protease [Bacteroides sp. AN502(2024)]|uniref:HK97 family phage prohead protease n=1 Tax=Bacteroides sp. AN502(2024) TaxID=3160599 RepID=UPI003518FA4E